jgi:hypothetical protein
MRPPFEQEVKPDKEKVKHMARKKRSFRYTASVVSVIVIYNGTKINRKILICRIVYFRF